MKLRCEASPARVSLKACAEVLRIDRICFSEDAAVELENCWWWIIRDDWGKGIAFAGMRAAVMDCHKGAAYMVRSGVVTKWRGQGLQKRLIKARVNMARRHGFSSVITYVLDWNLASANSLISCGFKLYTPNVKYAGNKAYYFKKPLK